MAGALRLPIGGAPVALGPDKVVGLRLEKAVQCVDDRLPDQLAQIGPETCAYLRQASKPVSLVKGVSKLR